MPPAVRSKSRFQNIFPIVTWAQQVSLHWDKLDEQQKERLSFLPQSKGLLEELILLQQVITQMSELLKIKGMNKCSMEKCAQILSICQQGRPLEFKIRLLEAWQCYKERLDNNETLLCSSDIIESYFGRFKQKIKSNGMQAITETVLTMSGWATQVTKEGILTALRKVTIKDIKKI